MTRRSLFLVLVCGVTALSAGACRTHGELMGDDLTDAGELAIEDLAACGPKIAEVGQGSAWSDLYRDIFGPTGRPGSCSFKSNCHGADAKSDKNSGYNNPSGIQCDSKDACWTSFTQQKTASTPTGKHLATVDDAKSPDHALLFGILRTCTPPTTDGGAFRALGIMPQEPSATFQPGTLARVREWVAAGVPNN